MIFWSFVIATVALALIVKSADYVVEYAARIARRFGVSEFVIGLTLVAVGTSLPELSNMIVSSYRGVSALSLGNILGSNMANICISLGLAIMIGTIHIIPSLYRQQVIVMIAATIAFFFSAYDRVISQVEGAVLLGAISLHFLYMTKVFEEFHKHVHAAELAHFVYHLSNAREIPEKVRNKVSMGYHRLMERLERAVFFDFFGMIFSGAVLLLSSTLLVDNTIVIADYYGVASSAIGATVIAIGTTAPELSVSLASVRKGFYNMLIGNLIGSNIINILLIVGVGAVIRPIDVPFSVSHILLPFLLAMTVLFSIALSKEGPIRRYFSGFFILSYVAFLIIVWII